ncbi:hypothetical protein Osc1_23350 [Hominimerdicola sp. 21CYCFAH17_S]|mgnify:CR=1 FL=1
MIINKYAPIIPYEGMGGIKLYSSMEELRNIISAYNPEIINDTWIRYEINNIMYLFFHKQNRKLFKITTMKGYCGKLFDKISVDTYEEELTIIDSSFSYDEFEEVWESDKGVFIETDVFSKKATWITIYIPEMDNEDFDNGEW